MYFKNNCVFGINELLIFKIFVLFVCFFHLIEILFYIFVVASFQSRESEVCGLDYEHSLPFGRSSSRELKWKKKDVNTPRGTMVRCTKSRLASLPEFLLSALTIIFFVFLFDLRNRFRRKKGLHSKNLRVV